MAPLPVPEAVHVAPENHGPLCEELVVVAGGVLEARVLQPEALELRGPDGEIRGVGLRVAVRRIEIFGPVEEEARIEAPRELGLDIAVEPKGVPPLENERRARLRTGLG